MNLVPANPVRAMADGDMLAVMTFALFLGIGLLLTPTDAARHLETGLQGLYDVTMRLLALVIRMAPLGIACLVFTLTARLGFDVMRQLGAYVAVVLLGLAIQQFGVYAATVRWLGGMSPLTFYPRRARGDADGVLDLVEQRHAADRAPRRRAGAPPAAPRRRASSSPSARPPTRTAPRSSRA